MHTYDYLREDLNPVRQELCKSKRVAGARVERGRPRVSLPGFDRARAIACFVYVEVHSRKFDQLCKLQAAHANAT